MSHKTVAEQKAYDLMKTDQFLKRLEPLRLLLERLRVDEAYLGSLHPHAKETVLHSADVVRLYVLRARSRVAKLTYDLLPGSDWILLSEEERDARQLTIALAERESKRAEEQLDAYEATLLFEMFETTNCSNRTNRKEPQI